MEMASAILSWELPKLLLTAFLSRSKLCGLRQQECWSSPISLSSLNGANGFILNGINSIDESGFSVASAGDVNGDGIDDLIVGAPPATSFAGQSYVIFGSKNRWSSPISLLSLNGANGFILNGINPTTKAAIPLPVRATSMEMVSTILSWELTALLRQPDEAMWSSGATKAGAVPLVF